MSGDEGYEDLVAAWRSLASRYAACSCALERELQERHGIGMSEFEVIDRLAGRPDCGQMRMQELAEQVHLSQSALSRAVARLERDGLVCRELCANDRRGVFVTLTDAGRERYAAARPTQRAVLVETLGLAGAASAG
ncbi:MarR family transcriptional regulator [Micromonospora sp. NPDC049559]|uniref:MarR family winged helix-turn-helix transcriptional regulator n=1 Tax=Micromonospora sp. NPDC049559 TaxID=3155923 RepID=UPI003417D144